MRVVVRPVHQATELIPLVHAADLNPVTHANRDSRGKIDVMSNQQRAIATGINNEALMAQAIVIVRQQPFHEACDLDPATGIALLERLVQELPSIIICRFRGRHFQSAIKVAYYPAVSGTIVISTRRLA